MLALIGKLSAEAQKFYRIDRVANNAAERSNPHRVSLDFLSNPAKPKIKGNRFYLEDFRPR
jgi:hypothetical protein